jgi:multiple sugar transport system permease protein
MAEMRGIGKAETIEVMPTKQFRRQRIVWSDQIYGYCMIAPLLVGLVIFYIWPIIQSFYFSFTKWGTFGKYHWTGLSNYVRLFQDVEFGGAMINTLLYTVISVPISMALSVFIAVLLNQQIRGMGIYRTLYYLPSVTMPAALAIVWRWLYNGDFGLINYTLGLFSIQGPRWISDPQIALYSIILVSIWGSVGGNMVLLLAGLRNIPSIYYEAAALDGAGRGTTFFRITLPLLSPTIFFGTVMSMIGSFQMFDMVLLMIGPGPALPHSQTAVYLFYNQAFILGDKGYAAAIAMVLFVIIMAVTLIQFRLQKHWVHYE